MATAAKSNQKLTKGIVTVLLGVVLVAIVVTLIILLTMKNGFVTEADKTYYYVNNEKQIGWVIDGDDRYYFDEDGAMHKGWLELNGNKYYFRKGDASKNDRGGQLLINTSVTMENGTKYYVFDEYGRVIQESPVVG